MPAFAPPPGYPRVKVVRSFEELISTPFGAGVNALCWPRALPGDYCEIVAKLAVGEGINNLDDADLHALSLSAAGRIARDFLLQDQELLRARDLSPSLDCIQGYLRDTAEGPVATDVCSFHVDSAPVAADTWLCTYLGSTSEGLRNDEARRHVDIPETRAVLLQLFGGLDGVEFAEFLHEHHYDLHYAAILGARPFSFGVGNLWRIACEYPGSPVPPCIHRAPVTRPGEPARLLLIS